MEKQKIKVSIANKKAFHEYEIMERYEAGVVLQGTEVKSIRQGRASFKDSYVRSIDGELWLVNFHITPYEHGSYYNHEAIRNRKLLLHKFEIRRLISKIEEKGLTIVPLKLYMHKGLVKVEIGLARGKKLHDKRTDIAKRDMNRDAQRELKNKYRVKM